MKNKKKEDKIQKSFDLISKEMAEFVVNNKKIMAIIKNAIIFAVGKAKESIIPTGKNNKKIGNLFIFSGSLK